MMKKLATTAAALLCTFAVTMPAYAGTWQQNSTGWWYQNDNYLYPQSQWQWIDGNGDGIAECYYFNEDGYLLTDTVTPDGYTVNKDGAWAMDGSVQLKVDESLNGPSRSIEAKKVYESAVEKTSALGNLEANLNMDVAAGVSGYDDAAIKCSVTMNLKYKNLNTSDMKFIMDMKLAAEDLGYESSGSAFYSDGYYYMDMEGEKVMMPTDLGAIMSQVQMMNDMYSYDANCMKNVKLSLDENGNRVISYDMDTAAMVSQMNEVYKMLGVNMSYVDMDFKDVAGKVTLTSDGYCKDETVQMDMVFGIEDEAITISISAMVEYVNPGQPVDFELPSTEGYTNIGI